MCTFDGEQAYFVHPFDWDGEEFSEGAGVTEEVSVHHPWVGRVDSHTARVGIKQFLKLVGKEQQG